MLSLFAIVLGAAGIFLRKLPARRAMAWGAIAFVRALGLTQVDVLGFSIGGMVAREITYQAPALVRKLILMGTGPRGAGMAASQSQAIFAASYDQPEDVWLKVHFSPSAASQAAGRKFLNANGCGRIVRPR